ncbi:hypothetical protein BGZ49_009887 [Haplosporangium sp. Z 27]|nr:hypothetical protein BGZ49_009887 [Haplosporangium sp. Z 27]
MINEITLFCILDGESTAFSIDIPIGKTVDHLKDAIKKKQSPVFDDIRASDLTLWSVVVPDEGIPVNLEHVEPKTLLAKSTKSIKIVFGEDPAPDTIHCIVQRPAATELDPTDDLSDVFEEKLPKKTIHIIVRRPPQDATSTLPVVQTHSRPVSPPSSRPGSPSRE